MFFKDLFHRNSIELFETLEKIGVAKFAREVFAHDIVQRTKLKTTNLRSLSKNISLIRFMLSTVELHKSNDWYGHATALKKYAGMKNNYSVTAAIEHGPFFGNFIWPQDLNNSLPAIITFSKKRAEFLRKKTGRKTFSIGPYIHYAHSALNPTEIRSEKKILGKSLLVFPVHSTSISPSEYDIDTFCREIKRIGKKFDSTRVCLYWKDFSAGKDKYYKKQGFEVVTAGHIFDPIFLPRLKSIITLSDLTISNGFGTYIGYSIFMRKPHYLFVQKIKFQKQNIDAFRAIAAQKSAEYRQMEKAFSKPSNNITTQQYNLASSFFGFDQIKSPKEIKEIFRETEKLWRKREK